LTLGLYKFWRQQNLYLHNFAFCILILRLCSGQVFDLVYNKTQNGFNKNIWIPAFAGMTKGNGQFCYKLLLIELTLRRLSDDKLVADFASTLRFI
jgi:hypothetical protein